MNRSAQSITRGLRVVAVVGVALVVLLAYGAFGTARATHSSCGEYCWNVYAPYINAGTPYSESGSGNQAIIQADYENGDLETSQQSQASSDQQSIFYAEPWIEGNPPDFYTPVGVTLTFTTVVEASYTISTSCYLGESVGIVEVWVEAGLAGTSYAVTNEVFEAQQPDECILSPHGSGATSTPVSHDISGGWGGVVTSIVADYIPAGVYTPFVQIIAETYAEVDGIGGATSSLNMETGGYYAQWINVNINWGPGEG